MLILVITVLGLMLWSVRLVVSAFRQSDFSLLFAGTLVALSSAGIVTAYSLMHGCMGYLSASEVVASGADQTEIATLSPPKSSADAQWLEDAPIEDAPLIEAHS